MIKAFLHPPTAPDCPQSSGIAHVPEEAPCCATLTTLWWDPPSWAPPQRSAELIRGAQRLREAYLGGAPSSKEQAEALAAALLGALPELQKVCVPQLGWARTRAAPTPEP